MMDSIQRIKIKHISLFLITLLTIGSVTVTSIVTGMSGVKESYPPVVTGWQTSRIGAQTQSNKIRPLRIISLNIAHGRKDGPNQVFLAKNKIKSNLTEIAEVIRRVEPDVVALQEVDAPSIWSGSFHQAHYLSEKSDCPFSIHGAHVSGMKLSYGTGILSKIPLYDPVSFTFEPSPPTFPKGFVMATVTWPGSSTTKIDVVSVHLDFSRNSVRYKQVEEMVGILSKRVNPLIIMGDFNSEWAGQNSAVRKLVEKLNLKAYQAGATDMVTFRRLRKRLDWILISPRLKFLSYGVLPDTLSDHSGVSAEVELVE